MRIVEPSTARGRRLEALVADLFRGGGYRVSTNVRLVGASGTRYEVDVLADADDGLVARAVAVECKNHAVAADADVIARMRMLLADLRIASGVVVCPAGFTPAARAAAEDARLTLWDADTLAALAGDAAVRDLAPTVVAPTGCGLRRCVSVSQADRAVRAHVRGVWGMRREQIDALHETWIGVHELTVDETVAGRGGRHATRRIYLCHDAVAGSLMCRDDTMVDAGPVPIDAVPLPVTTTHVQITEAITSALTRRARITQPAAIDRYTQGLKGLGISTDAHDARVVSSRTIWMPLVVARATRRDQRRIVVVDATDGHIDELLGDALTGHINAVLSPFEV